MPFLSSGGKTFKTRVYPEAGDPVIKSTGTQDRDTARAIEGFAKQLRHKRRWDVAELILSDRTTLAKAYDARADLDAFVANITTPDLSTIVGEWAESGANARYVSQVRAFIPKGKRFPLEGFRLSAIAAFLKGLPVGHSTKQHYRAALSMFAQYLIECELIEFNPVRDVKLKRPAGAKHKAIVYLEPKAVKALVLKIDSPRHRALEALMAGSAIEWQASQALLGRDIDFDRRMVLAKGDKNQYRTRWIEVTEDWAWDIFAEHAQQFRFRPDAKVFAPMDHGYALELHHEAAKALELRHTTLHHHRHSYAVMWIRERGILGKREDNRDIQWLKNQFGHAPESQVIHTTYGLHIRAAKLTAEQDARMTAAPAKRSARVAK